MDVSVTEHSLPGIGMRYDIALDGTRRVFVVAEHSGARTVGVTHGGDTPDWTFTLERDAAVIVASLLLGARFTLDTRADEATSSDEVVVDTVTLGAHSPAIGRTVKEIRLPDPEAVVLAAISDTTPDLVEDDAAHRCHPGDRLVLVARADQMEPLAAYLRG